MRANNAPTDKIQHKLMILNKINNGTAIDYQIVITVTVIKDINMTRTIAIVLLIIVGIYCLPTLLAILAAAFGIAMGIFGAILGVAISLAVTVLPVIIVGYLIWWLIRDNRRSRQY
jgi:hypothetical protein